MAELAGSIIGIVSAGTKVALVLSQLAADVGSAGHEARMIGGEIRSFCAVLKTLGDTMEKVQTSAYYTHCAAMIEDMTDASLEMFSEILNAAENLKGMAIGKDNKDGKFSIVGRVQWAVFKKPKIQVLRAAIEAYKSNLALMLATLSTAEKVTRNMSVHVTPTELVQEEQDRTILQSLELDQRASLIHLEAAERQYEEEITHSEVIERIDAVQDLPVDEMTSAASTSCDDGLITSAREDIESIRSSLTRISIFDSSAIPTQVMHHSQRMSIGLVDDQRRLTQRWSAVLAHEISPAPSLSVNPLLQGTRISPAPLLSINEGACVQNSAEEQSPSGQPGASHFDPRLNAYYKVFRWWLDQRTVSDQNATLTALLEDAGGKDLSITTTSAQQAISALVSEELPFTFTSDRQSEHGIKGLKKLIWDQINRQDHLNLVKTAKVKDEKEPTGICLRLNHQQIRHVPKQFFYALGSQLIGLALGHNHLTGLPDSLAVCTKLRHLKLNRNNFKSIPPAVFRLPCLEVLDMRDTKIDHIPEEISSMSTLRMLLVARTQIKSIPLVIGYMESLEWLVVTAVEIEYPTKEQIGLPYPNISNDAPGKIMDSDREILRTWTNGLKRTLRNHTGIAISTHDQSTSFLPLDVLIPASPGFDENLPCNRTNDTSTATSIKIDRTDNPDELDNPGRQKPSPGSSQSKLRARSKDVLRDERTPPTSPLPPLPTEALLPHINIPAADVMTTNTKITEHRRSRSEAGLGKEKLESLSSEETIARRRSFHVPQAEKRYSRLISTVEAQDMWNVDSATDSSLLNSNHEKPMDDSIRKYMENVGNLSPPPVDRTLPPRVLLEIGPMVLTKRNQERYRIGFTYSD